MSEDKDVRVRFTKDYSWHHQPGKPTSAVTDYKAGRDYTLPRAAHAAAKAAGVVEDLPPPSRASDSKPAA